jgi:protein-L-isoaspartate O-methyltransferase
VVRESALAEFAPARRATLPLGSTSVQELIVIEKRADGTIRRRSAGPVSFVPMKPAGK